MSNRPRRLTLGVASLGLVLVAALSGCSSDEEPDETGSAATTAPSATPAASAGPNDVQYVALGDSYASAPGVPQTDPADGCFRSDHNYAHVLAETNDLYLTDATCSGADSDQVLSQQVPMLSPDTDVVTVGTGGNDFDLFISILQGCLARADSATDPDAAGAETDAPTCSQLVGADIAPVAAQIQAKMGEVLDAIGAAAPNAETYVVGYPGILPTTGETCPDLVPMAGSDYPVVADVVRALSEALEAEAKARDLPYVDVYAASEGHDVCSEDPWVNGIQVGEDGTAPFHPFAVEQAAVAALVGDML